MSGGRAALPIWTDFMKRVEPEGSGDFTGPAGCHSGKSRQGNGRTCRSQLPAVGVRGFHRGDGTVKTMQRNITHKRAAGKFLKLFEIRFGYVGIVVILAVALFFHPAQRYPKPLTKKFPMRNAEARSSSLRESLQPIPLLLRRGTHRCSWWKRARI